jgi:hypothetical protein
MKTNGAQRGEMRRSNFVERKQQHGGGASFPLAFRWIAINIFTLESDR